MAAKKTAKKAAKNRLTKASDLVVGDRVVTNKGVLAIDTLYSMRGNTVMEGRLRGGDDFRVRISVKHSSKALVLPTQTKGRRSIRSYGDLNSKPRSAKLVTK